MAFILEFILHLQNPRTSSSSSDDEDAKKKGKKAEGPSKINYRIAYDRNYHKLKVTVVECKVSIFSLDELITTLYHLKDLKKADIMTKPDPYVLVHLLPGNHEAFKTKVVKNNYNPMYNETFTFSVPTADIDTKTVVLQVKLRYFFSLILNLPFVSIRLLTRTLSPRTTPWARCRSPSGRRISSKSMIM